jgi:signal transduction histidine kinase
VLEVAGAAGPDREPRAEILGSIASQAATALENARLYREIAERERSLRWLVHRLMRSQEDERRRLALELHDDVAQIAAGMQHYLEAFAVAYPGRSEAERARLATAIALTRRMTTSTRRLMAGLRPTQLDQHGLARGLGALAESLADDGLTVEYTRSFDDERLAPEVEIALFRVAQEALTNVRKHAGTDRAELHLVGSAKQVTLEVRDRGRGFDPLSVDRGGGKSGRLGLLGMRERVAQIGGTLAVSSSPGAGTFIRAVAPLGGPLAGRSGGQGA